MVKVSVKDDELEELGLKAMKFGRRLQFAKQILLGKNLDASRIVTESVDIGSSSIGIFGGLGEETSKTNFEQVTVKDLMDSDIDKILPKIIKSDPSIDQASDFFTTLTTQDHKMTAETDRAEREIEEINEILAERNSPLDLQVAHCASSLIMRGDICAETEFSDDMEPLNFWINDPTWVEWRLVKDGNTEKWALGNYKGGQWVEIDSPNVFYLSGNPLIGERSSRSPLQTALFPAISHSSMIKSLQSILDVHAWAQTLFSVQKLELIKLSQDPNADMEDDVNTQIKKAMALISEKLAKKKPDQIMGMTNDIKPVEMTGGGESYTFTKDIGELYDKRISMGSKLPSNVGGNQSRADYSTRSQNLFYSLYLQSGQQNIGDAMEWGYKRFLIARGVTDDPIYTSKSVNVESRRIEAESFQEVMKGIDQAVKAGVPLPLAIEFFEEQAGQIISANLKAKIVEQYEPPDNNDNDGPQDEGPEDEDIADEDASRDDEFIVQAGAVYLRKKILKKLYEDG